MSDLIIKKKLAFQPMNKMLVCEFVKEKKEKTKGGLIMPDSVDLTNTETAKVLATADEDKVKVGETVYFWSGMGRPFLYNGTEYVLVAIEALIGKDL